MASLKPDSPGLPPGSYLSDFAIPSLARGIVRASDLVGMRYVLLFAGSQCRHSAEVLSHLGEMQRHDLDDESRVIVILTGGHEVARPLAEQLGLDPATTLVQEEQELFLLMRVPATPAAYRIDEHRRTIGPIAVGVDRVIQILPAAFTPIDAELPQGPDSSRSTPVLSLPQRQAKRGAVVPDAPLRSADGNALSIGDFLGRRTVLVLWSPGCLPCVAISGALVRAAAASEETAFLIVNRGRWSDGERSMLPQMPNTVLAWQERRQLSRALGCYDAPAALIIDAGGTVATEPAKGDAAVVALLELVGSGISPV
jgi:hypothetical protein